MGRGITKEKEEGEAVEAEPRNSVPYFLDSSFTLVYLKAKGKHEDVLLTLTKQLYQSGPLH